MSWQFSKGWFRTIRNIAARRRSESVKKYSISTIERYLQYSELAAELLDKISSLREQLPIETVIHKINPLHDAIICQCGNVFKVDFKKIYSEILECPVCGNKIYIETHTGGRSSSFITPPAPFVIGEEDGGSSEKLVRAEKPVTVYAPGVGCGKNAKIAPAFRLWWKIRDIQQQLGELEKQYQQCVRIVEHCQIPAADDWDFELQTLHGVARCYIVDWTVKIRGEIMESELKVLKQFYGELYDYEVECLAPSPADPTGGEKPKRR